MVVFSLLGWSPFLPSGFLVSRRTLDTASLVMYFVYRIFTFFDVAFQLTSTIHLQYYLCGPYPKSIIDSVWAAPISLATTLGIAFAFFSSGYLDVSVPRVPLIYLSIQYIIIWCYSYWVPSFGYLRILRYLLLPVAFRSLSRPSSAPCTKAFSVSPL